MANSIMESEPISEVNFTSNLNNPTDEFDPLQFPPLDIDFLSSDLTFPEGGFDLGDDFDFSLDDLSFLDDNENFNGDGSGALSSKTLVESQGSGDRSGDDRGLNCTDDGGCSSSQDSGGCRSVVNGFLNSPSPESGVDSAKNSSNERSEEEEVVVVVEEVNDKKVKVEGGKGGVLKRKMGKEEETPNLNRGSKLRKAVGVSSPNPEQDDEDKRKARLMRNRESAQLSRQRKKHYVEELEDKVKSMHSVITDLNNKISYFMAENATLRQQLSGGAACAQPPPGMYPASMAPMPYPWMPYPMKPQGSVPLVPIPRLRPQQPVSAPKAKKLESKKKESKVKKAASVSFLGLLFFILLFGGLVPFVDVRYRGRTEMVHHNGFGFGKDGLDGPVHDRVLTVNGSHKHVGVGLHGGKSGIRQCGSNGMHCKRGSSEGMYSKDKRGSQAFPGSDGFSQMGNFSEPLVASLYVPRNDKLVKIDGNLIINSVLASEKAKASTREASSVKSSEADESSTSKVHQTSLAIAGNYAPPYAVSNNERSTERHPHVYRISGERQKALNRGSRDGYKENLKPADGSLQKWFHEGLTGPIFSSGMCTEVFQFDTSPAPGAIIPATSTASDSAKNPQDSAHLSKRNRRILGHLPMTLNGSEFNNTKFNSTNKHAGRSTEDGKLPANESTSSMVVSVLVDPRENGDGEGDGVIPQKSMSRIFVVVLMDSVKYVTYSCILPLKGSGPHLVTT